MRRYPITGTWVQERNVRKFENTGQTQRSDITSQRKTKIGPFEPAHGPGQQHERQNNQYDCKDPGYDIIPTGIDAGAHNVLLSGNQHHEYQNGRKENSVDHL